MRTIAGLFGKSPFAPLQTHMGRVTRCIDKLTEIVSLISSSSSIQALTDQVHQLEHEADITKNDIRNHLPKSIFLPIERSQFLRILELQDALGDQAEEIAETLSLQQLQSPQLLIEFYQKNLDTFKAAQRIIHEVDQLVESSFGGIEAEKVKTMVEETVRKEKEARQTQMKIRRHIYASAQSWPAPEFYLWMALIDQMGNLSTLSEKLANQVRMVLELRY